MNNSYNKKDGDPSNNQSTHVVGFLLPKSVIIKLMQILTDVTLSKYTTMRLGGPAKYLVEVRDKIELQNTLRWAKSHNMPIAVIGSGSNSLFTDEGFEGMVIVNKIEGFEVISKNDVSLTIRIGGGENWDETVKKTVEMGLSGIEALSAIPGTAGAAPVQNIGAYGQEIADTFIELEAYDLNTDEFTTINKEQCEFGYRTSILKNAKPRRYIISSITIKLGQTWMQPPFYPALQTYFEKHNIGEFSPSAVRTAVMAVRASKLPDPKELASCGSFFKAAVVDKNKYEELKAKFPDIPAFEMSPTTMKIPAGWLVEMAGYKGIHDENGMGTYDKHALVVVNHEAKSYQDLVNFINKINKAVQEKFGLTLEQEPELITSD